MQDGSTGRNTCLGTEKRHSVAFDLRMETAARVGLRSSANRAWSCRSLPRLSGLLRYHCRMRHGSYDSNFRTLRVGEVNCRERLTGCEPRRRRCTNPLRQARATALRCWLAYRDQPRWRAARRGWDSSQAPPRCADAPARCARGEPTRRRDWRRTPPSGVRRDFAQGRLVKTARGGRRCGSASRGR